MNDILPKEAHNIIQNGEVVVIDVRTPAEFEESHIYGAKNIDIKSDLFEEKIKFLDHNETYVVNCQMGGRSARAVTRMVEMGFKNVRNLSGGIVAWGDAGFPVEKSK